MLPQAQDFLDESEAVYALVSPLPDEFFETKTGFKNWTINTIIGHLYMWNWAADLTLKDSNEFLTFLREVLKVPSGEVTKFERKWLGDLRGQGLVKAWHEHYLSMAQRFGNSDPKHRVKWAGPDMTVRSKITARLMETWAHAQAIYDVLGETRQNGDRISNIVILGVNTYGWTFKNARKEPPGKMPHLKLTAPSGAVWHHGEESNVECIEGSAEEFCQVVTQTRNIADTSLKVTGPIATAWMANAQCFAGPSHPPPAPGSRKKMPKPKL
eukprot:gnl/TRDRNA2_/TRDRNA2_168177_c0_seq1.p1 gnl/TRDRNA2_/TRDRNA2_168177_c0~~gnl/TRDRNA2_/TRDRNA2_168177_c0_seq1.p1  ORF type:complete len:280 (+),score=38.94 gnl/TRDRNA2_/TRDRNA2_168177_c0_seq1:36-842(+)